MNTIQKWFSYLHIILAAFIFIISLYSIGDCEGEFFGGEDHSPNTLQLIFVLLFWIFILVSPFVYITSFILHLYYGLIHKSKKSILMIKIFTLEIVVIIFWLIITLMNKDNGHCDLFWGPADTGFVFLSFSLLIFNYLIISIISSGKIISPKMLFNVLKNNGCENKH
jgi:hypothetical protein